MTTSPAPAEVAARTDAVYATTWEGKRLRVSDPADWTYCQFTWRALEERRREGFYPHVRYFEVRSVDDPGYAYAPLSLVHFNPVLPGRGFKTPEAAARKAWNLFAPAPKTASGVQGTGGWYYWPNGHTAAQGLRHLARLCLRRGMIVQGGGESRWYLVDLSEKS